jgi:hypothetical protein
MYHGPVSPCCPAKDQPLPQPAWLHASSMRMASLFSNLQSSQRAIYFFLKSLLVSAYKARYVETSNYSSELVTS